jgi:selenocysteine-specific elongation factor
LWLGKTTRQQRVRLSEIESSLGAAPAAGDLARLKLALEGAIPPEEAERIAFPPELRSSTTEIDGWFVANEYRGRLGKRIGELAAAPGGVRVDELGSKLRGEPQALLRLLSAGLVESGVLTLRGGVLFPAGQQAPQVSPMGRQLLRDLQSGGERGLELSKLKVQGARKELRNLARAGLAVALEGDIYYGKQVYLELVRRCLAGLSVGSTFTIALTKERTGLSRKYVIPLLNRMERDGFVKRSGNDRLVTALPE